MPTPDDQIQMESSWKSRLLPEFHKPYMESLRSFLRSEKQNRKVIFPPNAEIFSAFSHTPFDKVKVIILGQDPYPGRGQAHGLCFSVKRGVQIPASLKNIYQELKRDVGFQPPVHGCLESWSDQGVLLLNAVLTVEEGRPASHQNRGWELFTDAVIAHLVNERENLVFLLWGSYAQKKGQAIDRTRHLVLASVHPSPLSAYRGFLGCSHFSHTNAYLKQTHQAPICWQLPN